MYELVELNTNMKEEEYQMYQDIPSKESGSTNLCKGLPFEVFNNYLEREISRKYQKVNYYDTPTITYILYFNKMPIGYICLRTEIDENWKKWSGNVYYTIRLSERRKGYGSKILELSLDKFRELGFKEIFCQSSSGNIASAKVIEKNGGIIGFMSSF